MTNRHLASLPVDASEVVFNDACVAPFSYEYPRPNLTADAVIFTLREGELVVLLIKRKADPFKGAWAIPGGFVNPNEPLHKAAARELAEETGLKGVALEQVGTFGDPGRDPRGHTVSVAYFAYVPVFAKQIRAGDDASELAWIPMKDLVSTGAKRRGGKALLPLAFDHRKILAAAWQKLADRILDRPRATSFDVLPEAFTLEELRLVAEAILDTSFDPKKFRAQLLKQKLVEPVTQGSPRSKSKTKSPLYRWTSVNRLRADDLS